jgi:hypothetical protein
VLSLANRLRPEAKKGGVVSFRTMAHAALAAGPSGFHNLVMRPLVGIIVSVGFLFGVYMLYLKRMPSSDPGTASVQAVSLTAIRMDLLQIGQAEKMYIANNSKCASLDELISANSVTMTRPERDGYTYSVDCSSTAFTVTATHPAPPPQGSNFRYPTLMLDQTLQVQEVQ